MILYCATTNPGKIREFRMAAHDRLTIEPLPGLKDVAPPEESGTTFEANAVQKALYYGRFVSGWLFAEDSGVEVDALGGEPGVYSARFSGPDATDESNNALLLDRMAGVGDRTARYVCAIALVHAGELVRTFRGMVEGQITEAPRGAGGFGYDPLFYYLPFRATFGEVERERKQAVSHRGKALKQLIDYLQQTGHLA